MQKTMMNCSHSQHTGDAVVVYRTENCTSSLDKAWALSESDSFHEWASVLADAQSQGRGQYHRHWHSPRGNIYGALRLADFGSLWANLTSLMVADAMVEFFKQIKIRMAIKWPNDLLVGGRKVGGILIERKADIIIAGIGLNMAWAPAYHQLDRPSATPPIALSELGIRLAPVDIWPDLVCHMRRYMQTIFSQKTPETFIHGLTSHLAYVGERVLLDTHTGELLPVLFNGIHIDGGIKIETVHGKQTVYSASIHPMIESAI